VKARELSVPGAFELTFTTHGDDRGRFWESFRSDEVERAVGRPFPVAQANTSVSRRGVLRGIHFADVPAGQGKYISVSQGRIWDVVVDLRVGSPRFGRWDAVELGEQEPRAVLIPEGCGHGFLALEDDTAVTYLLTDIYRPGREHEVHPFDPDLAIRWPIDPSDAVLSSKDREAPGLSEALERGLLPSIEECTQRYADLMRRSER
jgi:dTDP-4-dehydrorhamnose 3,5-epimerase